MKITKLSEPGITLYYQPDKALYIPVYLLRNTADERLFVHFMSNTKAAGINMLYRKAYIRQPYDGQDYWKQPYYARKLIDGLRHIAARESLLFETVCKVSVGKHTFFFYKGCESTCLPEGFREVSDQRQTPDAVAAFCSWYQIDRKEFQYPSDRLSKAYHLDALTALRS